MLTTIIAAVAQNNAIGKNNQLLWHLPADIKRFKEITSGHHVIMGRKTYESIGKPLPNRVNIVISRDLELRIDGCKMAASLEQAIIMAKLANESEAFIIGGQQIYKAALSFAERMLITEVEAVFEDADVFFPKFDKKLWNDVGRTRFEANEKHKYAFSFTEYEKY